MTYLNLMRLWPARNVLASVNMAIMMRTFVLDTNIAEAEKIALNERFFNIQKMKVAGDNLFQKFVPPVMPIPAASLENFTSTQAVMQESLPPPHALIAKPQIQLLLERANCTVMPSDISVQVHESFEDNALMEVCLDINRIQVVTLERTSLAELLCDVNFNARRGGRDQFIEDFMRDADCYCSDGNQDDAEQKGYLLGFINDEFFKNISPQTLEKMVGIDIYEVDVTISIRLGYHRVAEAEKIASTIRLAIGEATDSTVGVGWLLTTRTMSQDVCAEHIIPRKSDTGYKIWSPPGGAPALHTYLVDLVGHIRDGDYSYNDTTAEWRSAFGFDPQTDGDSTPTSQHRYVKVGTSTEMMQTMHKVADSIPPIKTLYAILAEAIAETTYWRENGCLVQPVSDLLHVYDNDAPVFEEDELNVRGANNEPPRAEHAHTRIMMESATFMRPANQDPACRRQ